VRAERPTAAVALASLLAQAPLLLALLPCASCRAPARDLASTRALLGEGRLAEACERLEALARAGSGTRAERLETARSFVDCAGRAGELSRVEAWLGDRPEEAVALYARALLEVTRSPASLPSARAHLDRAARLWADEGEIPFRTGLLLLADERAAEALPELQRACRLSDTAACAVTLAHALLDLGRVEDALAQARRVVRLDPRPADLARGRALVQRVAKRERRIPEDARSRYLEALGLLGKGSVLDEAGAVGVERILAAARMLEALVGEHPRLAAAHTLLGLARLRLGENAEAVVNLRTAEELAPHEAENPFYLGLLQKALGRPDAAATCLLRARALDPFERRIPVELGPLLTSLHRPREAAEVFEALPVLDGDTTASRRLAARASLAAGALDRAEHHYARLLAREPSDFEANVKLARILLDKLRARSGAVESAAPGDFLERAAEHLRRAAKVHERDPELDELRARIEAAR
jgi:tetratricopeptide (TPR) repeat protein